MEKEICQIITKTSSNIYTTISFTHAEKELKTLQATLRLDFHGVADLLPADLQLPTKSACIISYVGTKSPYRPEVIEEIHKRMASGQINFGVLVFVRGSKKNRNCFTNPGSKAWINSLLQVKEGVRGIFIDDMEDHILSTQILCHNIESILFTGTKEELVRRIESTLLHNYIKPN